MSWPLATAIADVRKLLSDGATDKPRMRKKVFGDQNNVNTIFQTFEFRRVTNFTTATAPLGIYVNGVIASVSSDSPEFGQVTLTAAPQNTDTVEASYYVQWFTDEELEQFLTTAAEWIGTGVVETITQGLRPSVKQYAAAEAYQKLAMRYAEMDSVRFRLEDGQNPLQTTPVERYMKLSAQFQEKAEKLRKQFYTRQDQNESPLFATVVGNVPNPVPNQ